MFEYRLTASGRELGPMVEAFGIWGQRRIEADLSLQHLDVQLLMWDMRRNLNTTPMPQRRNVVQFVYPELPAAQRSWWLIVDPEDGVDLCSVDPGFDVDLYVSVDLRTMTAIWMGLDTVRAAVGSKRMMLTGDRQHRVCHADLARSQPVCKGEEARELTASTVLELEAGQKLPDSRNDLFNYERKSNESRRKLLLRSRQTCDQGGARGHGLLSLQFLSLVVWRAGQRLQPMEAGSSRDRIGRRAYRDVPENAALRAQILQEVRRSLDDQPSDTWAGGRVCCDHSYAGVQAGRTRQLRRNSAAHARRPPEAQGFSRRAGRLRETVAE